MKVKVTYEEMYQRAMAIDKPILSMLELVALGRSMSWWLSYGYSRNSKVYRDELVEFLHYIKRSSERVEEVR